jgi:hypothetical protein
MFDTSPGCPPNSEVAAAIVGLATAVSRLQHLTVASVSDDELLRDLADLEMHKRRLVAVDHTLISEVESRGLARRHGCTSTTGLLRKLLRLGAGEADGRVRASAELGPRRSLTGATLEPLFPTASQAVANGEISAQQARVITGCINALPAAVAAEHDREVEQSLTEHARQFPPEQLNKLAARITDVLNPDGICDTEADLERRRGLDLHVRRDGSCTPSGLLSPALTEVLRTVLDVSARPTPAADATPEPVSPDPHSAAVRSPDTRSLDPRSLDPRSLDPRSPDPRSASQRRHDGLLDALTLLLRTDELPAANGVAATVQLTITSQQLQDHAAGQPGGLVPTGHGSLISLSQALSLARDARVIPVIFGTCKNVTAYGSTQRIFTEGQRLAMIARDQGCSFPGCDAPPAWCQAHHIQDYALGGPTSVDNGTLLCGVHHREHQKMGWTCHMSAGIPHWTAPSWLDPDQTPRRNLMHDPTIRPAPTTAINADAAANVDVDVDAAANVDVDVDVDVDA